MIIESIEAREILDSRGTPTVEADVVLRGGAMGRAAVPSGASVGRYEAHELRDEDPARFFGKGVLKAVGHIKTDIAGSLVGKSFTSQTDLDLALIGLDGSPNKARLGANALLAVSLAFARASAEAAGIPLYASLPDGGTELMPVPMMNVINGGEHASNNIDIQEFMIMPLRFQRFTDALRACAEVYMALKKTAKGRGLTTTVGDEGGLAPQLGSEREALNILMESIRLAGYDPGNDFCFAIDAASSEWHDGSGKYRLPKSGMTFTRESLVQYWNGLVNDYPIVSLEDGMAQDDEEGWKLLTDLLGKRIQLVGDDLFVTNPELIQKGIAAGIANSVLIKLNQIGTLSETLQAISTAASAGYTSVISHRSGETEDTFIADLAVACGCGQIKTGAPARSERTAKYNRLIRIEEELGEKAVYPGANILKTKQ
jgi:enolase